MVITVVKFTLSWVERQRCWTKTALGIDALSLLIFVPVFYRWCKFTVCAAESRSIKKRNQINGSRPISRDIFVVPHSIQCFPVVAEPG